MIGAACAAAVAASAAPAAPAAAAAPTGSPSPPCYAQLEYVLSGYLDPPLTDEAYTALAGANFSGVFGDRTCVYAGGAAKMCTANAKLQAALCQKHGLRSCYPGWSSSGTVKLGPAVQGYYLRDEPHRADFKGLAETAAGIHKTQPGAAVFINLLGGWMGAPGTAAQRKTAMDWWGYATYEEYVDGFIEAVRPDLISFDNYPQFGDCGWSVRGGDVNRSGDTRDIFLENLQIINNKSLAANLSFWNYFDNQAQGGSCGPSAGKVAWQMYAAALHGSRGLLHFLITPCKSPKNCGHYGRRPSPPPPMLPGGAGGRDEFGLGSGRTDPGYPSILTPEGNIPFPDFPPYVIAKTYNSKLKALGPHLMQLRTCSVLVNSSSSRCTMGDCASRCQLYLRATADWNRSQPLVAPPSLRGWPVANLAPGDYNLALFQKEGAKSGANEAAALMLQNHDAANCETYCRTCDGLELLCLASTDYSCVASPLYSPVLTLARGHTGRWVTVMWAGAGADSAPPEGVREVDQLDGKAKPLQDAAPHVDGFQIQLGAGEARLYLLGG